MGDINTIELLNGSLLTINKTDPDTAYNDLVDIFFKPYYIQTNDLGKTIHASIKEAERISSILNISKGESINQFLKTIQNRLPLDIAELKGDVDKIEILFENIDDLVQDISEQVKSGLSQEEIRLNISYLVENLNLFELSELLIHFARKIK